MDEIIALQAALAKAQLADTAHRISERNAVEIVLKLMELKKVQLIFSKSGREYVTPAQVIEEVEMELISHGGRVTLVDLAPVLNIDFNHIETAARALVQKKKTIMELSGQLLTSWYLDGVVEELNESLQESGSMSIVECAQRFSLPADFMRNAIEQRLGTCVQGYIEEGQLYTQSFIQLHSARTRGIFRALIKPTPLRTVIQRYSLMESRVCKEVAGMIKEGVLAGTLKGTDDRAIYTPNLFLRGQDQGAENFFQSNGFIEYKKLERLSIANPKAFVTSKFPSALQLQSLALSGGLVSGCVLSCEDAATAHLFTNAQSILPNILTRAEVEQVLAHAIDTVNKQHSSTDKDKSPALFPLAEVWAVSSVFRTEAQAQIMKQLEQWMDDEELKANLAAQTAAAAVNNAASSASGPATTTAPSKKSKAAAVASESEEEEEESNKRSSKSKAAAKKSSKSASKDDDEDDAPAPAKSKEKKGGRKKKGAESSDEDEPVAAAVAPAKAKGKIKLPSSTVSTVLTRDRVLKWLKSSWNAIIKSSQRGNAEVQSSEALQDESTEELIGALATLIHPACLSVQKARLAARAAAAAAVSVSASGVATSLGFGSDQVLRRQQLEAFRSAIQEQYEQLLMYQHAIEYAAGTGEEGSKSTLHADRIFLGHLESHLSKTLVAGLFDLLIRMEALTSLSPSQQNNLPGLENLVTLAAAPTAAESKEESKADKDVPVKPKFDVNRTPLTPKDRETILAALPKRSTEVLKLLGEVLTKEPSIFLDRFESNAKAIDLNLKKLDKKTERSRIFTLRKTLMGSLTTETKPGVVLHLTVLLVFAKVHSVVVHAPARVLQTMRRMLKPDMKPVAYAHLRRYNQLVMRSIRNEADESSASSSSTSAVGGGGSDSEDEAADDERPKDQQIPSMSIEAIQAELAAGLEQIRAYGLDASTAVKETKK